MKTIAILLLLTLPGAARTQTGSGNPPLKAVGAFYAISVADLEASTRWYREKLGLAVVMEVPKGDQPAAVTVLEGGGLIVELIQHDSAAALSVTAGSMVHGLFKVGMIVDDFEATVASLRGRGVEIVAGPFPARQGQRANVLIKDNAGNLIQVFGEQ